MGRYYGIGNSTTNQVVSDYWKGDSWCDCHCVMHQFHWSKDDEIFSASCGDNYTFHVNDDGRMEQSYQNHDELVAFQNDEKDNVGEQSPKKYGFDRALATDKYDHVPVWEGNTCTCCDYVYVPEKLSEYEAKFDETFFAN